ncbi:hypothetical protein Rs2_22593 [Raphanus sativus]|nr:hypothetical protein Rs2_22593 [Raphanus sativus]
MQNPNLIIFSLSLTALFLLFSSSHELKIRLKSLTPDHLSHGGGRWRRSLTEEHGLTSPDICRSLSKLAPLSEKSCVEVSILRKRNEDLVKGCIRRFKDYEKQLPESKVLAKEAGIDEDMAGELRKQLKVYPLYFSIM